MLRALRLAVAGLLPVLLVVTIAFLPQRPTYAQGACVTQQPGEQPVQHLG